MQPRLQFPNSKRLLDEVQFTTPLLAHPLTVRRYFSPHQFVSSEFSCPDCDMPRLFLLGRNAVPKFLANSRYGWRAAGQSSQNSGLTIAWQKRHIRFTALAYSAACLVRDQRAVARGSNPPALNISKYVTWGRDEIGLTELLIQDGSLLALMRTAAVKSYTAVDTA